MSSCGPCATLVVAGLAAWGSLRAMRIHTMVTALSALLASACTSIVVDVDPSEGGAAGEVSEGSSEGGSTGLGGSETGAPGSTGAADGSGGSTGSTGSTGGEPSTTTGDAPSTGSESSTGDPPACLIDPVMQGDRCQCGDTPIDPAECGCALEADGLCWCDDGLSYPPVSCGWTCEQTGPDACVCGNFPAPPDWCSHIPCVPGLPCWCEELIPPQPCPT